MNHYEKYIRMSAKLELLWAQDKGDSDEADCLRDQMDAPWDAMTEAQRDLLRNFTDQAKQILEIALENDTEQVLLAAATCLEDMEAWSVIKDFILSDAVECSYFLPTAIKLGAQHPDELKLVVKSAKNSKHATVRSRIKELT